MWSKGKLGRKTCSRMGGFEKKIDREYDIRTLQKKSKTKTVQNQKVMMQIVAVQLLQPIITWLQSWHLHTFFLNMGQAPITMDHIVIRSCIYPKCPCHKTVWHPNYMTSSLCEMFSHMPDCDNLDCIIITMIISSFLLSKATGDITQCSSNSSSTAHNWKVCICSLCCLWFNRFNLFF